MVNINLEIQGKNSIHMILMGMHISRRISRRIIRIEINNMVSINMNKIVIKINFILRMENKEAIKINNLRVSRIIYQII
jgi:hypothetical protein